MDSEPAQQATATPPDGGASGSGDGIDATQLPEMPLFSCKEAYVYRVPPATTVGHRAELWDVNNCELRPLPGQGRAQPRTRRCNRMPPAGPGYARRSPGSHRRSHESSTCLLQGWPP